MGLLNLKGIGENMTNVEYEKLKLDTEKYVAKLMKKINNDPELKAKILQEIDEAIRLGNARIQDTQASIEKTEKKIETNQSRKNILTLGEKYDRMGEGFMLGSVSGVAFLALLGMYIDIKIPEMFFGACATGLLGSMMEGVAINKPISTSFNKLKKHTLSKKLDIMKADKFADQYAKVLVEGGDASNCDLFDEEQLEK